MDLGKLSLTQDLYCISQLLVLAYMFTLPRLSARADLILTIIF